MQTIGINLLFTILPDFHFLTYPVHFSDLTEYKLFKRAYFALLNT